MYHEPQGTEPQWRIPMARATPRPHGHLVDEQGRSKGPAPPQPLPRVLHPPDEPASPGIRNNHGDVTQPSNSGALHALFWLIGMTVLLVLLQQPRIRRRLARLVDVLSDVGRGWPVIIRPDILLLRALRSLIFGVGVEPEGLLSLGSLRGQVVFIAGASGGIGFEVLWECLATAGAQVIAGVRSAERGEDVKHRIKCRAGGDEKASALLERVTFVICDFATLQSSVDGAKPVLSAVSRSSPDGRLDAFINTVGVAWLSESGHQVTEDGVEWLTGINALNPLATLLVVLAAQQERRLHCPPPKVIFFSSLSHVWLGWRGARYESWEALAEDQGKRGWLARYGHSKLTQLLLLSSLTRDLPANLLDDPIHAVNPGECYTPFHDTLCLYLVTRSIKQRTHVVSADGKGATNPSTSLAQLLQQVSESAWLRLKLAYYRRQYNFNCKSHAGALWRKWGLLSARDGANVGLAALSRPATTTFPAGHEPRHLAYWCYNFWTGARQSMPGTVARDEVLRGEAWRLAKGTLLEFFAGRAKMEGTGVEREDVVELLLRAAGDERKGEQEEVGDGTVVLHEVDKED